MSEQPLTGQMVRSAYRQTQREILAKEVPYELRWERMAELLNAHNGSDEQKGWLIATCEPGAERREP